MTRFVGRAKELDRLNLLLNKRSASFVVIRGRRRIGKSRLIEEFGKSHPCYIFSGLPPTQNSTKKSQLDAFCSQMSQHFRMPKLRVDNWGELFWHLASRFERGRAILSLDEISWIGSKDPDFLGHLKTAWDLHFSKNPELILIVCGSVSSWIEKNILSSTGFVGRISLNLHLEELPIEDAVQFWNPYRDRVSAHEIFKVLSVTGGVPRYLEEILPHLTAEENIRLLCFEKNGLLFQEFDQIFSDLFSSKANLYAEIARLLANGTRTFKEISAGVQRSGGVTSQYLNDLIHSGFISEDFTWNLTNAKSSQLKKYRLSDNYIRFYLKYIEPLYEAISQGTFEIGSLSSLPSWNSIMGFQFENLVIRNVRSLLPSIRLDPTELLRYGPYFQRPTKRKAGCQIDLLIQTRLRTVFICEIKFSSNPVGMDVVEQIREKQAAIALPRGWSHRLVLIHVNGVSPEVLQSNTFDHVIDFSAVMAK